ncbi:MAG: CBS domain-containing protein [Patescibacteria group bacterium]
MIKVRDFMSTDPITTSPSTDVESLVRKMVLCGITGMPVVDESGKLLGMISIVDVIDSSYPTFKDFYENSLALKDFSQMEEDILELRKHIVSEFMQKKVYFVRPEDPLIKAFSIMKTNNIGRVPVVEGEIVVGMVDTSDVFHGIIVEKLNLYVPIKDLYHNRTKSVKHKIE